MNPVYVGLIASFVLPACVFSKGAVIAVKVGWELIYGAVSAALWLLVLASGLFPAWYLAFVVGFGAIFGIRFVIPCT